MIRQSPDSSTYGEVWIAYTKHTVLNVLNDDQNRQELFLVGYRCNNASCSTTSAGTLREVGADLWGKHLMQHSLAIRRIGTDPIEFTVVRSEKVFADCDNNSYTAGPPNYDTVDQESVDLVAHELTNPGNLGSFTPVADWNVSTNTSGVCGDRGMTSTHYREGEIWTCYTHTPDYEEDDVVSCNSTIGATGGAWVDEIDIPSKVNPIEDHPDVEFINGDRIVATSNRQPGLNLAAHANDKIRLAFPDHAGTMPIIGISGTNWLNHPRLDVRSTLAQLVYHRGLGTNAEVMHTFCAVDTGASPPVLCDSGSQWETPTQIAAGGDGKYPQIATDGNFTMVAYTAWNANNVNRVYVVSRCGTSANWSAPELVRTNTSITEHQSMAFGRPGLVLNKDTNVAHIVLLDGMDAEDAIHGPSNASLYWYRKTYSDCAQ